MDIKLTEKEKDKLKELLPTLKKLQQQFTGIESLLPQYRGKEFAKVFYMEGDVEYKLEVAFIKFLELVSK